LLHREAAYHLFTATDRAISPQRCIQARASLGIDVDFDSFVTTVARRAVYQDVSTIPESRGNAAAAAASPEIAWDVTAPLEQEHPA
jgi:hypothetical protein